MFLSHRLPPHPFPDQPGRGEMQVVYCSTSYHVVDTHTDTHTHTHPTYLHTSNTVH